VIEMDKNDVDEKLIKWNDIFEELVIDAKTLMEDLLASMNYVAIFAIILFILGATYLSVAILSDIGPLHTVAILLALGFIIFCSCASIGIVILQKWSRLRKRYNRLHSLQKEMESN